jgi:hypothetical protein
MKRNAILAAAMFAASSLMAADVKDDVSNAVKALGDTGNYSWTQNVDDPNNQFLAGTSEGKTKDGMIYTSRDFNGNTFEILVKGTNGAMNRGQGDGWQTPEEMAANNGGGGGGGGRGGFMRGGFARFVRTPTTQVTDVLKDVQGLKQDGDAYVGDLTDDGAKTLAQPFRGRRGGGGGGGGNFTPPEVTDAKASVKFWIKDGKLSRFQTHVTGKSTDPDGNPVDIDRTTTVDIKDIGSTKIDVPADVVKKIGG